MWPEPMAGTTCLYTTTPDERFLVDRRGPIVVGSACSGHGFKFVPLIGRVLADLVDGIEPDGPFRRLADPVTEGAATLRRVAAFKKLSIFFPMWNEEAYLGRALGAAHEACESLLALDEIGDYELIIVDDASTDGTGRRRRGRRG